MLNKRFVEKIKKYIAKGALMRRGGKYIVALSGGADSVTLALVLKQAGYDVEAAHCNFRLRGAESDRDERFCREFCDANGITLHVVHFDTKGYAEPHKVSIEMAARKLRYAYFEQLRKDINADDICVAHHKDDTVETVLMNLIRGTGIHGLTGIAARNGHIVRPLLCVFRSEIEEALQQAGQPYVTDSTNLEDDVVRNKIRLNLIPMMRRINPSVSESIAVTAARLTDAAIVFDAAMMSATTRVAEHNADGTMTISIDALRDEPSAEYVLFTMLKDKGFNPAQIESIHASMQAETGRIFSSATHSLLIDRGRMVIEQNETEPPQPMKIPVTGLYVYNNNVKLRFTTTTIDNFTLERDRNRACLDAAKIEMPLTVRRVKEGDRFTPFGMRGSKLVSDYLTDRKKNLFEKRKQLVITDAAGRIIWLVGERPANNCRITGDTQTVLNISLEK